MVRLISNVTLAYNNEGVFVFSGLSVELPYALSLGSQTSYSMLRSLFGLLATLKFAVLLEHLVVTKSSSRHTLFID